MTFLPFILAVLLVIVIRVIAGSKGIPGKICRWFWNTSFKLISFVPLCGWMAAFMIADTEKEKAEKQKYKNIGAEADRAGTEALSNAAEKQRVQRRREEVIREKLAARGYQNISLNDDCTVATGIDKDGNRRTIHITQK